MANPFAAAAAAADANIDAVFAERIAIFPMAEGDYVSNADETRNEHSCRGIVSIISETARAEGASRYDSAFPSVVGEIAAISVREIALGTFVPRVGDVIHMPDRSVANRVRIHSITRDGQGRMTLKCVAAPVRG